MFGQKQLAHVEVEDRVIGRLAEAVHTNPRHRGPAGGLLDRAQGVEELAGEGGGIGPLEQPERSQRPRLSPRCVCRIQALLLIASIEVAWLLRTRSYCATARGSRPGLGRVAGLLGDREEQVAVVEVNRWCVELGRGFLGPGHGEVELAGLVESDGQGQGQVPLLVALADRLGQGLGLGERPGWANGRPRGARSGAG